MFVLNRPNYEIIRVTIKINILLTIKLMNVHIRTVSDWV